MSDWSTTRSGLMFKKPNGNKTATINIVPKSEPSPKVEQPTAPKTRKIVTVRTSTGIYTRAQKVNAQAVTKMENAIVKVGKRGAGFGASGAATLTLAALAGGGAYYLSQQQKKT